jgi:hypothetical protein
MVCSAKFTQRGKEMAKEIKIILIGLGDSEYPDHDAMTEKRLARLVNEGWVIVGSGGAPSDAGFALTGFVIFQKDT